MWQMDASSGNLLFQCATAADWSAFTTVVTMTSAPSITIHGTITFSGTVVFSANVRLDDDITILYGDDSDYYMGYSATADALEIGTGSTINANVAISLDSSGQVGIGTNAPDVLLDVSLGSIGATDTEAIRLGAAGADVGTATQLMFQNGTYPLANIAGGYETGLTTGFLSFSTYDSGWTEGIRIDADGTVNVPTTLDVTGPVTAGSTMGVTGNLSANSQLIVGDAIIPDGTFRSNIGYGTVAPSGTQTVFTANGGAGKVSSPLLWLLIENTSNSNNTRSILLWLSSYGNGTRQNLSQIAVQDGSSTPSYSIGWSSNELVFTNTDATDDMNIVFFLLGPDAWTDS
jgi:hypothetical protein